MRVFAFVSIQLENLFVAFFEHPITSVRYSNAQPVKQHEMRGIEFVSFICAPNRVKPLGDGILLTPLRDKSLQGAELLFVSWLITFGIMYDQMFIVR